MPKASPKLIINLDLLKPQSNPEKLLVKLLRWLLSSGRFVFIFVEAIVFVAFIARFKLDGDLAAKKEAIEEQIPYIESLKADEVLIRQTQLKLSTITAAKTNSADFGTILKKIADQTPLGVKIQNINLAKNIDKIAIRISAQAQTSNDMGSFIAGLKGDSSFTDVNIANVGLEQGSLHFTIDFTVKLASAGGKKL